MRKVKNFFFKWYVQLFLVLCTTVMGLIGYSIYYQNQETPMTLAAILIQTFFSTLKLFTLGFDVDNKAFAAGKFPLEQKKWVLWMLQAARFFGLFLTGTTLFKVLSKHIAPIVEQFRFFRWNLQTEKLMLIGTNEDNCLLYRSADKAYAGMILSTSEEDSAELNDKGWKSVHTQDTESLISDQISNTIRDKNKKVTIIINTKQDELNLALSKTAVKTINPYIQEDIKIVDELSKAADSISQITDLLKKETGSETQGKKDPGKKRIDPDRYLSLINKTKEQIEKAGYSADITSILNKIEKKIRDLSDQKTKEEKEEILKSVRDLCSAADRAVFKSRLSAEEKVTDILQRIRIIVFGDKDYQAIFLDIQHDSFCPIKWLNKYSLTASDFVSTYPLTKFIPEHERHSEILTETGCITKEAEFNMILIGFGCTNQEIFNTSFGSNQFVQRGEDGNIEPKPVHYHIFDRDQKLNEKNLNHNVLRYREEFLKLFGTDFPDAPKESDYLPICPYPALISMYQEDINSCYFYNQIRRICQTNPLSINYIVIAISDDLSNIDLAQRLAEKKKEWGLKNIYIFTKVRDPENESNIRYFSKQDYIPFASEAFPLEALVEDEAERMASRKSRGHTKLKLIKKYPFLSESEISSHCNYEWLTMDPTMHMSNIYNFIGLRLKLNLIGFDYEKQAVIGGKNPGRITLQEYADRYSSGDPAQGMEEENGLFYSETKIDQREDFKKDLPRKNLAVQEHYRWNAFMIMNGFIPGTIEQVRQGREKDYSLRYHANITSMEGLFRFREIRAEMLHTSEAETDVIRYDYRPMDGAWAYLDQIGYDIVRAAGSKKPSVN